VLRSSSLLGRISRSNHRINSDSKNAKDNKKEVQVQMMLRYTVRGVAICSELPGYSPEAVGSMERGINWVNNATDCQSTTVDGL